MLVLAETATHTRVGIWSLDDESLRWLVDDPARNIEDAYVPFGSEQAVIVEVDHGASALLAAQSVSGVETSPSGRARQFAAARTRAGRRLGRAVLPARSSPTDLVRFKPGDTPEQFVSLTRVWERTSLDPCRFRRGGRLSLEIGRRSGNSGLALPRARSVARGTVVYVHGGPTWHIARRDHPGRTVFRRAGLSRAHAQLSRQHRLQQRLPRSHQSTMAGAGASRRTSAPESKP